MNTFESTRYATKLANSDDHAAIARFLAANGAIEDPETTHKTFIRCGISVKELDSWRSLVAKDSSGEIYGVGLFSKNATASPWLRGIVVAEDQRRLGVGGAILEDILDVVHEEGASSIATEPVASDIDFYTKVVEQEGRSLQWQAGDYVHIHTQPLTAPIDSAA